MQTLTRQSELLRDRYGRQINYLRLSVGEGCNLRCLYCPTPSQPVSPPLSLAEISLLAEAAAGLGIRKIRLTGGEPLLRPDLPVIVAALRGLGGLEIGLTTNGTLLASRLEPLVSAGLQGVNVSLDSLDPGVYRRITGCSALPAVRAGLAGAEAAGLAVKLNVVVLGGINDGGIGDFARLTVDRPWQVRLIEWMPFGPAAAHDWRCSYENVWSRLCAVGPLEPAGHDGVARTYRLPGGAGTIGLIGWDGNDRCRSCNRLRIAADGRAFACLYGVEGLDLRPLLGDRPALTAALRQVVRSKPREREQAPCCPRAIRSTGG